MYRHVHQPVNKVNCFQQIFCLGFSRTLHEKGPISYPLGALKGSGYSLKGSGYCLETLLHREERQLAQRPLFTRRLNHDKPRSVILCEKKLIVRVQVRVIISSCCFFCVFFFFFCFLEKPRKLYLEGRWFITLSPHPPPSPTRGCIIERISSRHYIRAQSTIYSGYKKTCFFNPPIDPSRCLLIPRLGLNTTSRLIGLGQPNHPSKRSPAN